MTDVIYPTAPFAADEFHQKYGFNDIKSDSWLTFGAAGEKTFDTGLAMNLLSKSIIAFDEAHNKPAADKFINSYNTLMDQFNVVLQHSNHPVAKLVGGISGFITQPTVATGGALLSGFIGAESAGLMANLANSRLLSVGARGLMTGAEVAAVTAPEAISHAYLAQTTPIHDDYRYMDSLREIASNFFITSLIHLGVVEPIGAIFRGVKGRYVKPVQVCTSDSMRKAAGKVEENLMNEQEPNPRSELHQGFNDQRRSGKDPKVEEVRANATKIEDDIREVDTKIAELKEKAKVPVEEPEPLSAHDIANRLERIEAKPEEARTPLEKEMLETLPRTEIIENLKKALPKIETEIKPEEEELIQKLRKKPQASVKNEKEMMEERISKLQDEIKERKAKVEKFEKARKKGVEVSPTLLKQTEKLEKEIKLRQEKIDEFKNRNRAIEKPPKYDEKTLKQIDKLEDQRAELTDKLDNHKTAIDVLTKPLTNVDEAEGIDKPLFYSDTDPISEEAAKISPEDEINGIPEGVDIKEEDFPPEQKKQMEAVKDEIDNLPNYKKLLDGIANCITQFFYKGGI